MVRFDMRSENQLRPLSCELGVIGEAAGSCKLSCGHTSVISRVYGPSQPKYSRLENYEQGTVEVEVSLAGDSTSSSSSLNIRKEHRMIDYIKRTLESIIMLSNFPKLFLLVKITVCHDDGSSLATCLNATVLALLDSSIPLLYTPLSIHISQFQAPSSPSSEIADITAAATSVLVVDPTRDEEEMYAVSNYVFTLNRNIASSSSSHAVVVSSKQNFEIEDSTSSVSDSVLSASSSSLSSSFSLLSSDCSGSFSLDELDVAITTAMKTVVLIESFVREVVKDKYV